MRAIAPLPQISQSLKWARTVYSKRCDPAAYYDLMGSGGGLVASAIPVINMGYWDELEDPNSDDAGERASLAMNRLVQESAQLSRDHRILEAGCGFGRNLIECALIYRPEYLLGLNISRTQLEIARREATKAGLRENIEFELADATRTSLESGSFDRVLVIEAAFHFDTRRQFFREAFRVLRPGGLLVGVDIIVRPPRSRLQRIQLAMVQRGLQIPVANIGSTHDYRLSLEKSGFEVLEFESIRNRVVRPCQRWNMARWPNLLRRNNVLMASMVFPFWSYPWDYVRFKARHRE